MTDRERAERVFDAPGVMVLAAKSEQALDAIAAEFAAVRAEAIARERAAVVAWVGRLAGYHHDPILLADLIERGAHIPEGHV